jgi:hypothetical protein
MGKAARANSEARRAWIDSLSPTDNAAREAAEALLDNFVKPAKATGMCYRMTYFLHLYLAELGIPSIPIVGWVTDGRDELAISHAWVDVGGRKIDVTLVHASPEIDSIAGKALILDRPVGAGADYAYFPHKERRHLDADEEAATISTEVRRLIAYKQDQHAEMAKRAGDAGEMRRFLDAASDGITYERLKAIVQRRP